jgi:hypothetical protein
MPSGRGLRTGTLVITVAGDSEPYGVALIGTGEANASPLLAVSPLRLGFGNGLIGPPGLPAKVTVANVGEVPVALRALLSVGDFLTTSHCAASLAPGEHCTLEVSFYPRVPGLRTATLDIQSNAVNGPHRVALSGVGCALPNAARRLPILTCTQ